MGLGFDFGMKGREETSGIFMFGVHVCSSANNVVFNSLLKLVRKVVGMMKLRIVGRLFETNR